jgi:hypothetical protein
LIIIEELNKSYKGKAVKATITVSNMAFTSICLRHQHPSKLLGTLAGTATSDRDQALHFQENGLFEHMSGRLYRLVSELRSNITNNNPKDLTFSVLGIITWNHLLINKTWNHLVAFE